MSRSEEDPAAARGLLLNGVVFSVAFSVLESCLASVVYFSTALVDKAEASFANALLFACFSLGSVFAPTPVASMGSKRCLVLGMSAVSVYVFSFVHPTPAIMYPMACVAGGFGALLWTAQGVYFAENARVYAEATASDSGKAIALFSGIFACLFPAIMTMGQVCRLLLLFSAL